MQSLNHYNSMKLVLKLQMNLSHRTGDPYKLAITQCVPQLKTSKSSKYIFWNMEILYSTSTEKRILTSENFLAIIY